MQSFFRVRTQTGRHLGVLPDGTVNASIRPDRPIFLLRPPDRPTIGFMLAPGSTSPLLIGGVAIKAAIQPWRLRDVAGHVTLHEPTHRTALAEQPGGTMGLQPAGGSAAFAHQLDPVAPHEVTPALVTLAQTLDSVLPREFDGPDMLDVIAAVLTPGTADLVQAVLRLLPRDQTAWLGGTLIGLPDHLARFAAAFPGDIWAAKALPDLRTWLATRRGPPTVQLPREWDFLAAAGLNGHPVSAAHAISAAARAGVPPRRPVCVVTTARNEGLYLIEWVAYHRLIGAEALFVYSNDNSDGSDDLLRALALAGEITWIENHLDVGSGAQPKAYGHAFGVGPGVLDYRWSLVIDLDEFFSFDATRFRSLPAYIGWQETQPVDAIALNWLVFGSSGAATWSDAPLVERFTKRLPWIDAHIKTISRSNRCLQSHPHHPQYDQSDTCLTRDCDGLPFRTKDGASFAEQPRADTAWISHYFLKSAQEFVWKFSRNRGDHALVRETDPALIDKGFAGMFTQQHRSPTMVDDARTIACAPGLAEEIARLRRLPGVAAAEASIQASYLAGLAGLLHRLRNGPQFRGEGMPYAALLQLCDSK